MASENGIVIWEFSNHLKSTFFGKQRVNVKLLLSETMKMVIKA